MGFWADLVAAIKPELRLPAKGFFAATPNAPIQGVLRGDKLELQCANAFTMETINKPEILAVVSRKASSQLRRNVTAVAVDLSAKPAASGKLDQLLSFGKAHSDIVKIRNN